ncbi:hypothetical protein [Pseudomonas serbica]
MPLTKPNQDLKRDLQGVASDLKWSAVELVRIAERLSHAGNGQDAEALRRMISIFQQDEKRLNGWIEEVGAGQIGRAQEFA